MRLSCGWLKEHTHTLDPQNTLRETSTQSMTPRAHAQEHVYVNWRPLEHTETSHLQWVRVLVAGQVQAGVRRMRLVCCGFKLLHSLNAAFFVVPRFQNVDTVTVAHKAEASVVGELLQAACGERESARARARGCESDGHEREGARATVCVRVLYFPNGRGKL